MFKKLFGIASCKGGVGKSSICINLAITLSKFYNKKVGLLDADVYGPSHPNMLGIEKIKQNNITSLIPEKKFGIESISLGYFLNKKSSVLLRGPIVSNTIKYLIKNSQWDNLDILLIDFPPGTGDVYLSLLRDFKFDGIILVSTPQKISTIDVEKSIIMLKKFNIEITSIIQNMTHYSCSKCGFNNSLSGNANYFLNLIKEFDIQKHYNIPFDIDFTTSCDIGIPFMFTSQNNKLCDIFKNIASDIAN